MPQLPFTFQSRVRPQAHKPEPPAEPKGPAVFTVSQLQRRLRNQLENDYPDICVSGEISNLSINARSGHGYFTLKDRQASLSVVMFKTQLRQLNFRPHDGMEVIAHGTITVWPQGGSLQMSAKYIEPQGLGALQQEFEERVAKLRAEGLTADERKRAIPHHPQVVGVVTSRGSAAMKDVLQTLVRRNPRVHIRLAFTPVQGRGAAQEISKAMHRLGPHCDVMIVARGGGSTEDLWAFNEEVVARAIVSSPVPVITGVGHETDTSIADLVADLRTSTPTAAAEHAVLVRREIVAGLQAHQARLDRAVARQLNGHTQRLEAVLTRLPKPQSLLQSSLQTVDNLDVRAERAATDKVRSAQRRLAPLEVRLQSASPRGRVAAMRRRLENLELRLEHAGAPQRIVAEGQRLQTLEARLGRAFGPQALVPRRRQLDELQQRLQVAIERRMHTFHERLGVTVARAEALSPMAVLARGYALVTDPEGGVVKDASQQTPGARLRVQLAQGELLAKVTGVLPKPSDGG